MFSKFIKNRIDQETHQDMLKSFQQSITKQKKLKELKEPEIKLKNWEKAEPSMGPAIKYLELQYKLLETSKPLPVEYPYDYNK